MVYGWWAIRKLDELVKKMQYGWTLCGKKGPPSLLLQRCCSADSPVRLVNEKCQCWLLLLLYYWNINMHFANLWENLCPKEIHSLSISSWRAEEQGSKWLTGAETAGGTLCDSVLPWVLGWFWRTGPAVYWLQSRPGPSCPSHQSSGPARWRLHQRQPERRREAGGEGEREGRWT